MKGAVAMFCLLALCSWASAAPAPPDTSCKYDLIFCDSYFNSTLVPPTSCCDPLKTLIKSDTLCLCNLLAENPAEKTQAYDLAGRCGKKVDDTMCSGAGKFGFGNQVMVALLLFILTIGFEEDARPSMLQLSISTAVLRILTVISIYYSCWLDPYNLMTKCRFFF